MVFEENSNPKGEDSQRLSEFSLLGRLGILANGQNVCQAQNTRIPPRVPHYKTDRLVGF
jgi:hypothetical protein